MKRLTLIVMSVGLLALGCGKNGGGGGSSTAPTPTVTSVSVAPATPNQTVSIGQNMQFTATSTLSNGQTEVRAGTWGSDTPSVATVSQTGLVTGVAAGQATIFVDVNPRGTILIRVFPDFRGTWRGNEVFLACADSGVFAGICAEPDLALGQVFQHRSTFTQTEGAVNAVIDLGGGLTATTTGTVSVGGDLDLAPAPVLPADPDISAQIQNWRSRADVPGRMTGSYEAMFTAPGFSGGFTVTVGLENVSRTGGGTAGISPPPLDAGQPSLRDVARRFLASE